MGDHQTHRLTYETPLPVRLRTVDSSSRKAVSFSSAHTTKGFPSPRCSSAIQIVRPLESIAETQPQLHPASLRLSAMISQYFMLSTSVAPFRRTAWLSFTVLSARAKRRFFRSADRRGAGPRTDAGGVRRSLASSGLAASRRFV
jgi:hypothetical protein